MPRGRPDPSAREGAPLPAPHRLGPTHWTVLILMAMALGAFLWVFHSLRSIPGEMAETGRGVARNLERVAAAFKTGTISTSFTSYATRVAGTSYFQFARLEQMEAFERSEEAAAFWGLLALPDVVVRATVPVEYTYYLDFEEPWTFEQRRGRIVVTAPRIRFNRPAADISALEYEVRSGSLFADESAALERLKLGISRATRLRAEENIELVRELGRQKTEEFVANWLASSFADGEGYGVEVVFADEADRLEGGRLEVEPGRRE